MTEARTKRKAPSNYCCIKNHIELREGMLKKTFHLDIVP